MTDLTKLKGLCASVCTSGDITPHFSVAFSNLRDWNSRNGFVNIEYKIFSAKLVESGRDAVCRHALDQNYDWLLMADADSCGFPQDAVKNMLHTMFVQYPDLDMLGAYAQLKEPPYLPVIDTGTGTWEPILPGQGIVEVIRTGGHFFMLKTSALKTWGPPWFRSRIAYSPLKAFKELDIFYRTILDGKNPLADNPEWLTGLMQARKAHPPDPTEIAIGEDSGFCDSLKAVGGRIAVNTDLVALHVGTKIIQPKDLLDALNDSERKQHERVGVAGYA